MSKAIFTRRELYDLVWSEPRLSISKKYNISDAGIVKMCKDISVPLPKAGHWEKIRAGKKVDIQELSSEYSGENEVTLFLKKEGDQSSANVLSPVAIRQQEIENDSKLTLIVPDKLAKPDELIISAKESLTQKRPHGLHNGLVYTSRDEISISVTPGNIGRALRFMDTFIKLLRVRGHRIVIKNGETFVFVGEQDVKINFREKTKRIVVTEGKYNRQHSEYHPTGVLSFHARISYTNDIEWKDGKLPLEKQLAKIITKIEIKAKEYRDYLLECWRQNDERREKERIKQEFEKRKEKELAGFKWLLEQSQRWQKANILRNYIDSMETESIAKNNVSDEHKKWLTWARKKVDWYDPHIEAEDELLKGVNRDTLTFQRQE
jgi:hypothetical protein